MSKCIVHNCKNHEHEGEGRFLIYSRDGKNHEIKWMCWPCHHYLTTGVRSNSAIEQDFRKNPSVWPPEKIDISGGYSE